VVTAALVIIVTVDVRDDIDEFPIVVVVVVMDVLNIQL